MHAARAATLTGVRGRFVAGRVVLLGLLLASIVVDARLAIGATPLGANKFDLLMQYEGYTQYSNRLDAFRRVTQAMARKAVLDAKDTGFSFLRVSVSGYGGDSPQGSQRDMLRLWQSDPATYWHRVDEMFDDLDRADLRLVPTLLWHYVQFSALTGDTTTDLMRTPRSASRVLAAKYIQDFVTRYRGRKTILFYELTNEFNLHANMDMHGKCLEKEHDAAQCASIGNYTQDELNGFAHDMVELIHHLDPSRQVSSGYALPPPWATHMAMHPEWTHERGYTPDSPEEFASNLASIHRDYDIVSMHVYPRANAVRFGRPPGSQAEMIVDAAKVAHSLHKILFVGEFGDVGATPFLRNVKALLDADTTDYAALWVWEFYQTSSFEPIALSIEPGFRDDVIALFQRPPQSPDNSPQTRVVLTWPVPCSRINEPVQISAMASDGDHPVADVEFQVDETSIGTVTKPPYRVTWDPAGRSARVAHLKAIAHAQSKGAGTDSADVLLNGANDACRVNVD